MSEVFSSEQVEPVESAAACLANTEMCVQLCTLCEKRVEPGGQEVERWILQKSAFGLSCNASDTLDIHTRVFACT